MPNPEDARVHPRDDPLRRLKAEAYCFARAFYFHDQNNHLRKAITLLVVIVWMALEIGAAYGWATLPEHFLYLRLFVGVLLGRMWDIEVNSFAGTVFSDTDREGE